MLSLHRISPEARRLLRMYWRRKWLLLLVILAIPAAVYGISQTLPKTYQASTTLIVRDTGVSSTVFSDQITYSTDSAANVARLLQTSSVARAAARELDDGASSTGTLDGSITTVVDEDTLSPFLTIIASAGSPQLAADIANAYAAAITKERIRSAQREIDDTLSEIRRRADRLNRNSAGATELALQLQQLEGLRAAQDNSTLVLESARPPTSPISPRPLRNSALALVVALLLAAGLAPALDWLNRRIRSENDLQELVDVPVLATVPEAAFPGARSDPAAVKEVFQTLRTSLMYFNIDRKLDLIVIVSPAHGEGKTTVSTNLATSLALDGEDVILIDGDLRRPQVTTRLGTEGVNGLGQVLVDDVSADVALEKVELGGIAGGGLRVLAGHAPSPNPAVLLGSRKLEGLLETLRDDADVVIIDTPPILAVADAIPLMRSAAGVVLVARMDSTTAEECKRAVEVVETARGEIVGSVLTGVTDRNAYGYGYYHGYGEVDDDPGQPLEPPTRQETRQRG